MRSWSCSGSSFTSTRGSQTETRSQIKVASDCNTWPSPYIKAPPILEGIGNRQGGLAYADEFSAENNFVE